MAPKACIIGAGVSGLRCATVLLENGFEVDILEARDRIGGRITQSDQMGPLKVDLGANWVHSTAENPIIDLCKETGTPLHQWAENTLIVDKTGKLVEHKRANHALKVVWEILESANEYSTASSEHIDPSRSLYDYFKQECDSMVKANTLKTGDVDLVLGMAEMWGAYVGVRVERQSLKFFFLEDCINGDDCFIPTNYIKIMDKISAKPLAEAQIRLETVMTSVQAIAADNNASNTVQVKTASGVDYSYDVAVITSPLGWLKRHKEAIVPLSDPVSRAIDEISYGNLEKVLIEFPSAFWETQQDHFEEADGRISFVHWISPEYASESNPNAWRLECVSFNAFPEPYRRNIILFYTYGECSKHITSMIHGKQEPQRSEFLKNFFEPYYSRLPNYGAEKCAPLKFLATEWSQDEYSGYGSYSNFQVGMTDAAEEVKAYRHGMPDKGIYFAGEATAPFDGLGTVAGAYNSGDAVARRIIDSLK